jgi:hypothetical protein
VTKSTTTKRRAEEDETVVDGEGEVKKAKVDPPQVLEKST